MVSIILFPIRVCKKKKRRKERKNSELEIQPVTDKKRRWEARKSRGGTQTAGDKGVRRRQRDRKRDRDGSKVTRGDADAKRQAAGQTRAETTKGRPHVMLENDLFCLAAHAHVRLSRSCAELALCHRLSSRACVVSAAVFGPRVCPGMCFGSVPCACMRCFPAETPEMVGLIVSLCKEGVYPLTLPPVGQTGK